MKHEDYVAQRITTRGDIGYIDGMGEVLRAARLYVALSKAGFAAKLGMAERSFVRMERGERPMPPGLLDSVDAVLDEFDSAVELMVERATRSGDLTVDVTTEPEGEWHRAVVGRACIESRRIMPILSGIRKEHRP